MLTIAKHPFKTLSKRLFNWEYPINSKGNHDFGEVFGGVWGDVWGYFGRFLGGKNVENYKEKKR